MLLRQAMIRPVWAGVVGRDMPDQSSPPEKQGASGVKRGYNQALMMARRNLRAALGQARRAYEDDEQRRG